MIGTAVSTDTEYLNCRWTLGTQDNQTTEHKEYMEKYVSQICHIETHACLMCNGWKLHVNNLCEMYGDSHQLFGMEPLKFPHDDSSGIDSGRAGSEVLYCREI